nr:unnamed protein product [Callosobruchus analis]
MDSSTDKDVECLYGLQKESLSKFVRVLTLCNLSYSGSLLEAAVVLSFRCIFSTSFLYLLEDMTSATAGTAKIGSLDQKFAKCVENNE